MNKQEIEARLEAIEYILKNDLYDEEMEDEIYEDRNQLQTALDNMDKKEPEEDIIETRKNQYGSFNTFVYNMTRIMNTLREHREQDSELRDCTITDADVENMFLVLKLLRMQTADDKDSLIDLSNYAKLIMEKHYGQKRKV